MSNLRLKCTNSTLARAPFQALMGELTVLPRPLAGFKGPTSKRRGEGKNIVQF